MSSVKEGMKKCPKCKGIREDVLEKCFVDAYELLCRNDTEVIAQFMKKIKNISKDTSNEPLIKEISNKIDEVNKKMGMLVDLHIEGNIDETVYLTKKTDLDKKKEKLQHDMELLTLEKEDKANIEVGLQKIEKILLNSKIMPEFDKDVFEAIVKKIIIGQEDDPLAVIFVLKNGDEYKNSMQEIQEEVKEEITYRREDIILDFFSNQKKVNFEPNVEGKTKKIIDKIRVKVVYNHNNML